MDTIARTASAAGGGNGPHARIADWLFLEGDRRVVAGGIILVVVGVFAGLVAVDVLAVGADSSVAGLFGSGLTAGVVTLLTIALSINQLILSRVFGPITQLADRMDGARAMRFRVEELAGESATSTDPAEFLSLLGRTLSARAMTALSMIERTDPETPVEVTRVLKEVGEYGRSLDAQIEPGTPVATILGVIVGPEYALNMTAVRHVSNEYGESLPANARVELDAMGELLEFVAITRQFFKTIALQRDFAALSRLLVYSGLVALLASVSLTLVYRNGSITLSPSTLRVVVPVGFGLVMAPLALFAAYILRAATVAHRTVSVGPFIPPEER